MGVNSSDHRQPDCLLHPYSFLFMGYHNVEQSNSINCMLDGVSFERGDLSTIDGQRYSPCVTFSPAET